MGSRREIKKYLDKFSKYEGCNIEKSSACGNVDSFKDKFKDLDLRYNRNKRKVLSNLADLREQDNCNFCSTMDGLENDLSKKWKRYHL